MNPISAFVGPNGSGKSLAVAATIVGPALDAGTPVYANVAIDHPLARSLRSWRQLDDLADCVLWLDEITAVFPSREFSKMPPQVARKLNQLRKCNVRVAWTAPHWQRCDVILRECTQAVTVCAGYVAEKYERDRAGIVRDAHGGRVVRDQQWPAYKLFRWKTYDAVAFESFTLKMVEDVRPIASRWYWRPWHKHQWLYDTMEAVSLMDHLDEYGVCVNCGGSRRRPRCSCDGATAPGAQRRDGAPVEEPGDTWPHRGEDPERTGGQHDLLPTRRG